MEIRKEINKLFKKGEGINSHTFFSMFDQSLDQLKLNFT
jgi:hypothetical protein